MGEGTEEWGNERAREKEISDTKELIEALAMETFERRGNMQTLTGYIHRNGT